MLEDVGSSPIQLSKIRCHSTTWARLPHYRPSKASNEVTWRSDLINRRRIAHEDSQLLQIRWSSVVALHDFAPKWHTISSDITILNYINYGDNKSILARCSSIGKSQLKYMEVQLRKKFSRRKWKIRPIGRVNSLRCCVVPVRIWYLLPTETCVYIEQW